MIEHDHVNRIVWFYTRDGWIGVSRRVHLMNERRDDCFSEIIRQIHSGNVPFTYNRNLAPIERKWCFFV